MRKSNLNLCNFASLILILAGAAGTESANAQVVRDSVPELMKIDIIEHLGDKLPLDLQFIDDRGRTVTLRDYFGKDKPVLLTLGYYECPMLCNLVFNGVSDGIKQLKWMPGEKYEIISVSIDSTETFELAAAKKTNYIKAMEMPGAENGWHFLVGNQSQAKILAESIGFEYYYVPERDEFAHAAAAYLISPDGVITRYLYGIQFTGRDLKLGLLEASDGKIGTTLDRIILYCFHYDSEANSYVLMARNVMKLGGLVSVVFLGLIVGTLWIKDRNKMKTDTTLASPTPDSKARV